MNVNRRSFFRKFLGLGLVLCVTLLLSVSAVSAAKRYQNWQEVASDMHLTFEKTVEAIDQNELKQAYDLMNEAYYGYYEVQGFEKNVMVYVSAARVNEIEAMFRDIKHSLLGNKESRLEDVKEKIRLLSTKVYRDALVLDGVEGKSSPDSVGEIVHGPNGLEGKQSSTEQSAAQQGAKDKRQAESKSEAKSVVKEVNQNVVRWRSFLTSFGLMMREGLEAILICVAIVAYLIKVGQKRLVKHIYQGMFAGLVCSVFLAFLVQQFLGGAGQELVEGWTMLLAVAVLFWVSHWMLHKSEAIAFERYINEKVEMSLDKKSQWGLIGAAFLAVVREGAELILFYQASLGGGLTDVTYSVFGFVAAAVILLVIYLVFRFTSIKIPLKPFFMFTSILFFVMCISFMGKGIKELAEGGAISGVTIIPAMKGFQIDELGIYDRAETVIPQVMLFIASACLVVTNMRHNRKRKAEAKKKENEMTEAKV